MARAEALVDDMDAKVIHSLMKSLKDDPYPCQIGKDALSTLSTLLSEGDQQAIIYIVNQGIISILCDILKDHNQLKILAEIKSMILISLDILDSILKYGKQQNWRFL